MRVISLVINGQSMYHNQAVWTIIDLFQDGAGTLTGGIYV
jgi:hypothetical protein